MREKHEQAMRIEEKHAHSLFINVVVSLVFLFYTRLLSPLPCRCVVCSLSVVTCAGFTRPSTSTFINTSLLVACNDSVLTLVVIATITVRTLSTHMDVNTMPELRSSSVRLVDLTKQCHTTRTSHRDSLIECTT
jgi:hypothetical protein